LRELNLHRGAAFALLALFGAFSLYGAAHDAPTIDEPTHLAAGFNYWTTGRYVANPSDPPLLPLIAALPDLVLPIHASLPVAPWVREAHLSLGSAFLYHNTISADRILNVARVAIILLGLVLGFIVWRWASILAGPMAGVMSLVIYSFSSVMLAYSHLTTPDFALAATCFFCLFAAWRYHQNPTPDRAFGLGFLFGLAFMTKFSALLIPPLIAIAMFLDRTPAHRENARRWAQQFGLSLAGFSLVVFICYSAAGFDLLPQQWLFLRQMLALPTMHYFNGHISKESWWWFPSICFLLKTPIPLLLMLVAGVAWFIRQPRDPSVKAAMIWCLTPAILYIAFLSFSAHFIGIRRVLFLYPCIAVFVGVSIARIAQTQRKGRIWFGLLAGWYVMESVASCPAYLSYFNEFAGGPSKGYSILVDCNSDWGQGLKSLGDYLRRERIGTIFLSYFGSAAPQTYGFRFVPVGPILDQNVRMAIDPTADPARERRILFAISATNLAGVYFDNPSLFEPFRKRTPVAIVSGSILVFDVTQDPSAMELLTHLKQA
jgi:4-amino-4-deoxy-L-arabinose transferase-like glycosyltransferase